MSRRFLPDERCLGGVQEIHADYTNMRHKLLQAKPKVGSPSAVRKRCFFATAKLSARQVESYFYDALSKNKPSQANCRVQAAKVRCKISHTCTLCACSAFCNKDCTDSAVAQQVCHERHKAQPSYAVAAADRLSNNRQGSFWHASTPFATPPWCHLHSVVVNAWHTCSASLNLSISNTCFIKRLICRKKCTRA